uniref:RING-type E3 ubiquitin transferase n=1 Tax=Ornithorhynchus anatinus TaxID=9258 RepID=A0A6I8P677_ORNAN
MGARQSGPAAANGRTRAYSGSDLPSGGAGANGVGARAAAAAAAGGPSAPLSGPAPLVPTAARSRSLATPAALAAGAAAAAGRAAPASGPLPSGAVGAAGAPSGSQDSVNSSPDDGGVGRDRDRDRSAGGGGGGGGGGGPRLVIGSLPAHLSPHMFGGFKCPVCSKFVPSDEMDLHLVMCLTKPRITYNEDVLSKDAGECAICLEELQQGDTIARLPCLCIYHKGLSYVVFSRCLEN